MPDLFLALILPGVITGGAVYLIQHYLRRERDEYDVEQRIRQLGEEFRRRMRGE